MSSMCHLSGEQSVSLFFFVSFAGVVSLVSLSLLSFERHSALFSGVQSYPSQYRRARVAVVVSWLYSLAWTLPPLLGWSRSKN